MLIKGCTVKFYFSKSEQNVGYKGYKWQCPTPRHPHNNTMSNKKNCVDQVTPPKGGRTRGE